MIADKYRNPVIELYDVETFPRITSDGYYAVIITDARWVRPQTNRSNLWVRFEVVEGACKGAWLQRRFYLTEKSVKSISYLCAAVGIKGKLQDPRDLVGKNLTVQVNIKKDQRRGVFIPEPIFFLTLSEMKGGDDEAD